MGTMLRILATLMAVAYAAGAGVDPNSCKKDGDYCLNHYECCSNTCLMYLYKCSKAPKQSASPAVGSVQSTPVLFAPPLIPTLKPETVSLDELVHIIFRPLNAIPKRGRELNAIESRLIEEQLVVEESNPATDRPNCSEIGEHCYKNDECCSGRCHGFLHKCVT